MPTASDYERWASATSQLGDHVLGLRSRLATIVAPTRIAGGTTGPLVARTLAATEENLATARSALGALVEECQRRASACRRWSEEMDAYDREYRLWLHRRSTALPGVDVGPAPFPPPRPGPWAERG